MASPNIKSNPYYAKENHVKLAKFQVTKSLIDFSGFAVSAAFSLDSVTVTLNPTVSARFDSANSSIEVTLNG